MKKNYRELHKREVRGATKVLSTEELLEKAKSIVLKANQKLDIRNRLRDFEGTAIRIDLVGVPEVSFLVRIEGGELKFATNSTQPLLAIGVNKEYFAELNEQSGAFLFDNVFLRKGRVRDFLRMRDLLASIFLGATEDSIKRQHVQRLNSKWGREYKQAKNKIMLIPQCLRNPHCKAPLGEFGYECNGCELECKAKAVMKLGQNNGVSEILILPGGGMVKKIIEKKMPEAILGIACLDELTLGGTLCQRYHIPAQGVPLLRDGCRATDVDLNKVKEKLSYGKA